MFSIVTKVLPILFIFLLGVIFKKTGLFNKKHADLFLKMVFYIALPSLIVPSIANIEIEKELLYLPIIAIAIILITFLISYATAKALRLPPKSFGVFLISTMIMNAGILFPFFLTVYGERGLARIIIFDLGNGFLTFTLSYFIAMKYGSNKIDKKTNVKKFLLSPPVWALGLGFFFNITDLKIPTPFLDFFNTMGSMITPLIMLSLGIYFQPKVAKLKPALLAIFIRMFIGFCIGWGLSSLLGLEGLNQVTVLLAASAPAGANTLTFSSLEGLDKELAATIVSYSIICGLLVTPIIIILFG